jgi:hypothetical protein
MSNKLMTPAVLSKTNFLCGVQCPKYLWMMLHDSKNIPQPDGAMQFIYEQGRQVGELAKSLFPGGVDIPVFDFAAGILLTREQLKCNRPIFEASIQSERVYCRPDILVPVGDDVWDIIEVKSSTSIKDVSIRDVAFQRYCCENAGVNIRNCKLAHINNKYVRKGEIDPHQLFIIEDITGRVDKVCGDMDLKVQQYLETISLPSCPEVSIGPHCTQPYLCPLQETCWSFLPDHSVFDLYWGGNKRFELFDSGITDMRKIPANYALNSKQYIQVDCVKKNEPYIRKAAIRDFLYSLEYPVYFLDFETFSTVLPVFDGVRPNQQIPFQFSVHVLREKGLAAEHHGFLAEGPLDPRPQLLNELKARLGTKGSVVAYHAPFEQRVLRELAETYPENAGWATGTLQRMVDLLKPFINFHYYHPEQKGSASLKRVLPAMTGLSYEGLEISDGRQAGVAYMTGAFSNIDELQKRKIWHDLEAYCGQDTGGMVEIVKKLQAEVS